MSESRLDQQVTLKDGRTLGYDEYGTPGGTPIFYFHGHPGSRIEWPHFHSDNDAIEMNARIIAADRPGHGLSGSKRGRQMLDWPDDVVELADALGIERFAVLGCSGGGPYAAACAFRIPERLTATAIVCGMGPADAPGAKDGISWNFAGKGSVMRRLVFRLTSMGIQKQPERFVAEMNENMKGPDRTLMLESPELAGKTVDIIGEALRPGIAGAHREAGLYKRPWGFRLQDITAEIHLWHGKQDYNVLPSVAHHVADAIPNCHATFLENEGHLTLPARHTREYLSVLVS